LTDQELLDLSASTRLEVLSFLRAIGPIEYGWAASSEAASNETGPRESDTGAVSGGFQVLGTADLAEAIETQALSDALLARLRQGFGSGKLTEILKASGLPRFVSRADVVNVLQSKELTEKQANALIDWVGDDIQWLLDGSETEEGRRRAALLAKGRSNGSGVDVELLEAWTSGPTLDKADWSKVTKAHEAFLAAGGAGGTFRIEIEAGLPRAIYSKQVAPTGQADFTLENLGSVKGAGLRLVSANFCGVRGDKANLARAELTQSTFAYGLLEGANFSGALLRGVDFSRACLRGADFRKADLTEVNFEEADLRGAQFAGAITNRTKFGGANVQGIKY
jgi:uncharacterized protein YjbI with pentapeptide repeats